MLESYINLGWERERRERFLSGVKKKDGECKKKRKKARH